MPNRDLNSRSHEALIANVHQQAGFDYVRAPDIVRCGA
jgi:hypothetical protein